MHRHLVKKLLWLAFYSLPLIAYAADFTDPRVSVAFPQTAGTSSQPVKVVIYKSKRTAASSAGNATSFGMPEGNLVAQGLKSYVFNRAKAFGVSPFLALWIVKHESSFNPRAKGDGDESRGLWQISKVYHPEVPDAVAFDAASSTDWSLERIHEGKVNEWSAYRNCRTLYADCPF
jgi:soluble lytic murein transglycosylase-like protein